MYLLENISKFKIQKIKAPQKISYPNLKFDIDTIDDYKKILKLIEINKISLNTNANKIIEFELKNEIFN